jgi:hypothetical protein
MKEQHRRGRTIFLLIAVAVFVVVLVFLLAEFSNGAQKKQGIVLPQGSSEPTTRPTDEGTNPDFVIVTPENLSALVESFEIPTCYAQTLSQTVYGDGAVDISVIQIRSYATLRKMEILQSGITRHLLSNGETLYLWYGDDPSKVEEIRLSADISVEDIAGIFSYASVASLPKEEIVQVAYIPLTQAVDTHYLYLSTKHSGNIVTDYWIDMTTGLLHMAETREGDVVLYSLEKDSFEVFDTQEEDFLGHFVLPDGVAPFAIEAE